MLCSQLLSGSSLGTTPGLAAKAACKEQDVSALGVFRQVPNPKLYCFCYRYFVPAHRFIFQLYWPESSLGKGAVNIRFPPTLC